MHRPVFEANITGETFINKENCKYEEVIKQKFTFKINLRLKLTNN